MGSINKLAKGAGIFIIGLLVSKLLAYAYRILLARTLGPETYGILMLAMALTGVLITISVLGLNTGIVRFLSYYLAKNNLKKAYSTINVGLKHSMIFGLIFTIALFLSANFLAEHVFYNSKLTIVLQFFSITIFLGAIFSIFIGISKGYKAVKYVTYSKYILENVAKVAFTAILLYMGYDLFGAVVAYVLAFLVSVLFIIFLVRSNLISLKLIFQEKIRGKMELIKFSLPLMFGSVFWHVISSTDTLMLGYFLEESYVGIYNAAVPFAQLLYLLPVAISAIFLPIITRKYALNHKIDVEYKTITKWVFFINLPIFVIYLIFSKQILTLFFGSNYVTGGMALMILSVGVFISALVLNSRNVLTMLKLTKFIFIATVIAGVSNIFLNFILIPTYGINGAALATSCSLLLEAAILLFLTYRSIKINPFKANYAKAILASIVATGVVVWMIQFMQFSKFLVFILTFIILGTLYFFSLIFLKSFEKADVEAIKIFQEYTHLNFKPINNFLRRFVK